MSDSSKKNMPHSLRVVTNNGLVYTFPVVKDTLKIGRSKENDIVLKESTVSRFHAQITRTKEGYLLTDLGSFNGTKVNNKSVQMTLLRHEDEVKIGLSRLTLLTEENEKAFLADEFTLIPEDGEDSDEQLIVRSSLQASHGDPGDLLLSRRHEEGFQKNPAESAGKKNRRSPINLDVSSLERTNKVLFVLYEISRQLSFIQDFNGLLRKIMDLIFLVIDADYGFLFLRRDESNDNLIPVVVKYRDDHIAEGGRAKASRTIIQKVIRDKVALLTSNAMADSRLEHAQSLLLQKITSAICVPLWMKRKIIGVIQLDSIRTDNQFTKDDLELLKAIGSQMAMVIEQASLNEQIRAEERMRNRLERFHSPQLIDMILRGGPEAKDDVMEPRDLDTTILFLDIVGFTPLAEQLPPREINMILNQYFTRMSDIIFAHDGMLDKYMGDGLMAVFGAPMEKEDDPQRAIRAALEMRKQWEEMMAREGADRKFKARIGINTGRVVAGNIGSPKRLDYTVIGDAVNIASRLESIAEPNQIVIGEETYRRVKGEFNIKKIGPRRVKGKSAEVLVYEVL